MLANQRCKTAEETIETETTNVEQLSKIVKEKEEQVDPASMRCLPNVSRALLHMHKVSFIPPCHLFISSPLGVPTVPVFTGSPLHSGEE